MDVYRRPDRMEDAIRALSTDAWTVVAGGTDHYPARVGRVAGERVLDITRLDAARGIVDDGGRILIGALTTWSEIRDARLPPAFDALRSAAAQIGGVQIQNSGTLGGNLCNASPAADGIPVLLIVDAAVDLISHRGTRQVPLQRFILGNRRTDRRPDELLVRIVGRRPRRRHASAFMKLGARAYQVISIAMVAALMEVDDSGRIAAAAVAVGACSEVAQRLPGLEMALTGRAVDDPALPRTVQPEHLAVLSPIDDVRGTADYRREAACTLVRRAIALLQGTLA